MTCCSGSGEILIVPRDGGPGGQNAEPYENLPALPQDVLSTWEEFASTAEEEEPGLRERVAALQSRPYVAWVGEETLEAQLRELRTDPRVVCATRNWRVSRSAIAGHAHVAGLRSQVLDFLAFNATPDPGPARRRPPFPADQCVRVGILDTGVDPSSVATGALDPEQLDATGLRSELRSRPSDHDGHGSIVATIVNVLAPDARLCSIRCFGRGAASLSEIVYGILFARLSKQIDVFNLSFSVDYTVERCPNCDHAMSTRDDRIALSNLFEYLRMELDDRPLMIAAAGNAGRIVAIPAALDGVVAVGSIGAHPPDLPHADPAYTVVPDNFVLARGGSRAAPVVGPLRPGVTRPYFGTSFATAIVTGVVAQMLGDPAYYEIPSTKGDERWSATIARLRQLTRTNFAGYNPATHGIGFLPTW